IVRVSLDGERISGVADSFGVRKSEAMLEPEVIGRLLAGAPAERVEVQLEQQKPYLVKGLLANEDRFFYYHPGIDPIRIVEATIADLRSHRLAEGPSTRTQQLARTFMERGEGSFSRKFRELAVAAVLEIRLRQDEILERYINDVRMGEYDGSPIEGMPQAARYFFNKDLSEVTPAEAATLIGMVQAPRLYDPGRHPDYCRKRRDIVLGVMKSAGVIDDATYNTAIATPIQITRPLGLRRAPYFTDYVIGFVNKIPGFDGHLKGLKVYTTLDTVLQSEPMSFDGWTPANYEKTYQPQVTVAEALFESLNVPTAYVGSRLGAGKIVRTAHEMGIHEDLPAVLPISIGADETTLLELASAYQVFATEGVQSPPYAVEAVVDAKGHQIYQHAVEENRVIRPAAAYLITGALKAVLRYGTGASAGRMGLDFPAAAKTGPTHDYNDASFIRFTPQIVCGVWVGFDEPQSLGLTGAQAALPAWGQFMQDAAPADPEDFPEPSGVTMATIDPESRGLATSACPKQVPPPVLDGPQP